MDQSLDSIQYMQVVGTYTQVCNVGTYVLSVITVTHRTYFIVPSIGTHVGSVVQRYLLTYFVALSFNQFKSQGQRVRVYQPKTNGNIDNYLFKQLLYVS